MAAGLTLLRGFVAAGKPRLTRDRLASFEHWDDLIRQSILWMARESIADLGDPTACIETAKQQEPERQKLAALLEAAASVLDGDWRVNDLIRHAENLPLPVDGDSLARQANLKDALHEIAGERGTINARRLGRWIERHDRNRCAGVYLERRGTRQRAVLWRIRRYDQPHATENNSQNSRNSLLSRDHGPTQHAELPREGRYRLDYEMSAANDQPVIVTLSLPHRKTGG